MSELPINYTRFGIANRFEDGIYLNEGLKDEKYRELHDWLLNHELQHTQDGTEPKDFVHDFVDSFGKPKNISKQYFRFYFSHRWAWLQSSPFWIHNGKFLIDLPKLWNFSMTVLIACVIVWWAW